MLLNAFMLKEISCIHTCKAACTCAAYAQSFLCFAIFLFSFFVFFFHSFGFFCWRKAQFKLWSICICLHLNASDYNSIKVHFNSFYCVELVAEATSPQLLFQNINDIWVAVISAIGLRYSFPNLLVPYIDAWHWGLVLQFPSLKGLKIVNHKSNQTIFKIEEIWPVTIQTGEKKRNLLIYSRCE